MIGKERLTRRDYPPPVDEIARMIRVDHAGEYGAGADLRTCPPERNMDQPPVSNV